MTSVGIDITPRSVRMIEIIEHPTKKVGKYAEASLTTSFAIAEGDQKEVKDILKKWKKEYRLEYIKVALPEEKAYLFDTEIEFGTEASMRSTIEFSIEENVPLSGSEVIFDFRLTGEGSKEGFVKVAVTVFPLTVINAYLALFNECELTPVSFLIEAQALSRALVKKDDTNTYIIVNIHSSKAVMFIISKGSVQFTSTIAVGALDFSKETNTADIFRQEIDKVSVYWNKHRASIDPTETIQKIILAGREALTPGFKEYLNQSLRMPVEVGNVWLNVASFDEYVPPLPLSTALNYGTAIGLALPENE